MAKTLYMIKLIRIEDVLCIHIALVTKKHYSWYWMDTENKETEFQNLLCVR